MDFSDALDLKKNISAAMLGKKGPKTTQFISFGAGTRAAALSVARDMSSSVNGVGITKKKDDSYSIKVLTRDGLNVDHSYLSQYYGVPQQDILVEKVGRIEFKNLRLRQRPLYPGLSAGHYKITTGTLGCFVEDDKKRVYILSNNHVLANVNKAYFNDPIFQPGPLDGGKKIDEIARLEYLVNLETGKPNTMDAALARVVTGMNINYALNNGKKRITGIKEPAIKLKVEKFGRTTGHTTGSITTRNLDLQVDYAGQLIDFEDQLEIKGDVKGGQRTLFCAGGDSGSLIIEKGTTNAVALLFAGAEDGTTFATPINDVLTEFSVKIL